MYDNNQKKRPGVSGCAALELLFDLGSYTELGAHVTRSSPDGEQEGVVCAFGAVFGRRVFAFAQDTDRMNGAFDSRSAKKIKNLFELALKAGAPVVGVFAGAGSVISEGSSLLDGISSLFSSVADAKGEIPTVALINGSCTGSMAVAASMFDFSVAVKDAQFAFGAEFLVGPHTAPSIEAKDDAEAFASVRALVNALPDNCGSGATLCDMTDLDRPTGISEPCDTKTLISAVSDDHSYIEINGGVSDRITFGFAPLAGRYVGMVGVNGSLDATGASAAARFVSFCSDFSIPLMTFIDSDGPEISENAERVGLSASLAQLALAYRGASAPRICTVVGSACGAILPIMGSRNGASDICFAVENSVISPLPPKKTVAFLMNDRITGKVSREELEKAFAENEASPERAAFNGDVDFVVSLDQLRPRLCSAVLLLGGE